MALYQPNDLNILKQNAEKIKRELKNLIFKNSDVNYDIIQSVHNKILYYCERKQRIIYGGYALNILLGHKNNEKKIYDKNHVPDIDIYSPTPINDIYELCNILYDDGFKNILCVDAVHEESYKLYLNDIHVADFSYVSSNIYNKLDYIEINKVKYLHPNIMMIDYFRMITNPISSYWRYFEEHNYKAFKRFIELQNEYPMQITKEDINESHFEYTDEIIMDKIGNFLKEMKTIVNVGIFAYNFFVNKQNQIKIPFHEIISTDYVNDVKKILNLLKDTSDILHIEYYPFFQYTDYSTRIYHKNTLICIIYDYNKKCVPYIEYKKKKIGTFSLTLLYVLINIQYENTFDNLKMKECYINIASKLIKERNNYFETNNKNFFDETKYKEFVFTCIGYESTNITKKYISDNNFPYIPKIKKYLNPPNGFIFLNTSGNKIHNLQNLKINEKID